MAKKIGLLLLAGLVILPGCYRVPQYRSKSLRFLGDSSDGYRESKNGFIARVKRLTNYDKKELFGQYSKKLDRYVNGPIEVVYVSFHNLSSQVYLLPSAGIDLEIIPHQEIEKLMKTSTAARIAGSVGSYFAMAMGGFLGWSGSLVTIMAHNAPAWAFLIPLVGVSSAIAGFVYYCKYAQSIEQSLKANKHIKDDLEDKTLLEGIIIQAGDKYEGLIFVKSSDYTPQFNVTMHEQNNRHKKLIFEVDLQQSYVMNRNDGILV